MAVEYTIHLREVAKLEVMSLNTDLTSGSPAEPFAVTAYDEEENEFDTLDGLQISWYLGSKRAIVEFEKFQQKGPVTKVLPIGVGKGALFVLLSDSNYKKLPPAIEEISVTAPLVFEPAEIVLLEHGKVDIKVIHSALND